MDDLGRWMRRVLDEVAPPVDPQRVIAGAVPRGRRVWPVIVGAAAVALLLGGGGYLLLSGTNPPTASTAATTTTTTQLEAPTTVVEGSPVVRLQPVRIDCTTELPAFPCSNLLDGDPTTDWQGPNGGIGARFTVHFSDPVTIAEVRLLNLADDTRFRRNSRIREVVATDGQGLVVIRVELGDTNGTPVGFGSGLWDGVTSLEIEVTAAYPGQSVGDLPPFAELALAEIEVYGYPSPVTTTSAPTAVSPITGTWQRTNPDLGGLMVQVRDLIWDGDAFYLLLRVGFGDLIIYRSADGLTWEEYSRPGTASTVDGPWHLASLGGRLVIGGGREAVAKVWVEGEGDGPWFEVTVAPSGAIQAITVVDDRLVAFGTIPGWDESRPEGEPPTPHARIWVSTDAVAWTEVAGDEVFGSGTRSLSLLRGESGVLAIGASGELTRGSGRLVVASSSDGLVWEAQEATGLGAWQVDAVGSGGDGGYLLIDGYSGTGYRSDDGVAWSPAFVGLPVAGDDVILSDAEHFGGYLVVAGSVFIDPGGGAFNYMLPGVWIHLGGDAWAPLGASEWFEQRGTTYRIVTAPDRLVVVGEAGSDEWALFTFVRDAP